MIRPLKGVKRTSAKTALVSQNDPLATLARSSGVIISSHDELILLA